MTASQKLHVEQWIAALRSGRYKQGIGRLTLERVVGRSTYRQFCCLGVACDLYRVQCPGVLDVATCDIGFLDSAEISYDGHRAYLPLPVQQWLGLPTERGEFRIKYYDEKAGKSYDSLSAMNDTGDLLSFDQIARVIEHELRTNDHKLFRGIT